MLSGPNRILFSAALAVLATAVSHAQTPASPRNPILAPNAVPPTRPGAATARNAGGRPVHNEAERVARWKVIQVPYNKASLSVAEQQMVAKLADACHQLDEIYLRQSDLGGYMTYHTTQNSDMLRLFSINGSRWDLLDRNQPFFGEETLIPGHELYPYGLKLSQIDQYLTVHPDQKEGIYNPWTVVRSAPLDLPKSLSQPVIYNTPDKLYTYPYHVAFAEWLKPMAEDLRAAAKLSPDPAFAKFLSLRADALLNDDYYASDLAWLTLKNPKVDVIFAPYETYLDDLLGVKTSYGAAILIRNDTESKKLAMYQEHEAAMQQALPIGPEDKPSKQAHASPMEIVDAPLRAGDLRYGYQAVADNLPNDPRVHEEKGSKKIFFKNFMDVRVNNVILPIAEKMLTPAQATDVSGEGYLTGTILHEISHGLGPAFAHVNGKQIRINEAIGPAYSGLEEAKADIAGLFLAKWLVDQKLIPAAELNVIYASAVAGQFRTLRFGTGEAHGRAEMMEFNYLVEQHAISQNADSRYTIDYAAMPGAIEKLATQLLTFEAKGDRSGAEEWFRKYDVMPEALTQALEPTAGIPVDVTPEFELAHGVRP